MNLKRKTKQNTVWLGLLVAIVLPFIVSVIVIMARSGDMPFIDFLSRSFTYGVYADMLRVSVIIDLIVFYYFLNKELYNGAKGVIIGALIVGLYVVYLKYG